MAGGRYDRRRRNVMEPFSCDSVELCIERFIDLKQAKRFLLQPNNFKDVVPAPFQIGEAYSIRGRM